MTDQPSVFINAETVKNVPAEKWVTISRLGSLYRAYPISIQVPTGIVTSAATFTLTPGFEGYIAVHESGYPFPLLTEEVTVWSEDQERFDPMIHWLLNRMADEWGEAGVITACAAKWPKAFEHVAHHKVVASYGTTSIGPIGGVGP